MFSGEREKTMRRGGIGKVRRRGVCEREEE